MVLRGTLIAAIVRGSMKLQTVSLMVLAGVACKSEPATAPQPLQQLASLDAIKAEFNAHAGEPRFVTLLSAT